MSDVLKITRQRTAISNILKKENHPLTAAEIFENLENSGENMALSTVYRTLSAMEKNGILEKITLPAPTPTAAYLFKTPCHIHYATCLTCKNQFPIPGCPIETMEKEVEEDLGFSVTSHQITLYGYCKTCQKDLKK